MTLSITGKRCENLVGSYTVLYKVLIPFQTNVQDTCNLSLWASMGITFRTGSSSTRTFGLGLLRHPASRSQDAPSRYRPLTKQPAWALSVTSSAVLYLVTVVYNVERSRGQPFFRHVACTSAVKYDSGMCSPDNQITAGSPSFTWKKG